MLAKTLAITFLAAVVSAQKVSDLCRLGNDKCLGLFSGLKCADGRYEELICGHYKSCIVNNGEADCDYVIDQ
ncbi:hypothetical protein DL89DRAFT_268047 [Linderina pennispora]|uniref:Uncharacterized protein n=1 Tax=Linderina pennispora TaxID=61395 RepID=A0A1Y1W635_9FUNG|nr:uncharacterized protein DL89DRAFT_268047 [Linderina pennispora]ORX69010.1 hypothetical protein DL89DRAFT_268047 [Linderina pennispora]